MIHKGLWAKKQSQTGCMNWKLLLDDSIATPSYSLASFRLLCALQTMKLLTFDLGKNSYTVKFAASAFLSQLKMGAWFDFWILAKP